MTTESAGSIGESFYLSSAGPVEITIGWTVADRAHNYSPYLDGWRPGAKQHEVTVTVDVPADPGSIWRYPVNLAEAVYEATNHPAPDQLSPLVRTIRRQIDATGYIGEEGGHFSLSMGDTVTIARVRWECLGVGFRPVGDAVKPSSAGSEGA